MTLKRILWTAAGLICVALGFVLGQQFERNRSEARAQELQDRHARELSTAQATAQAQVDAIARMQGESVLQAFAAGISPAVLAGRREGVELAAISLLYVPGIAGIHVLSLDNSVIYSSDAKLAATGDGAYRGSWALQATELTTRASSRPNVVDIAIPIVNAGEPTAVAWLEYDVAAAKTAANATTAEQMPSQATETQPNDTP